MLNKLANMSNIISRHIISLILITLLVSYSYVYIEQYNYPPIRSDGEGYYAYLPSYLIYKDLTMEQLAKERFNGDFPVTTGIQRFPSTGSYLDKYPIGVAVLVLPFFLLGHFLSIIMGYPTDGYSFFYQHSVGLSGLFYMLAGIYLLKKNLRKYFSEEITLATLLAALFGTNLFHYGTYDSIFSHTFSFFLFSALIFLILKWYTKPDSYKISILLGVFLQLRK